MIQPVVLAGGSGTRLWPASRRCYPKQLLALTGQHTLLQGTAARLQGFSAAPVAPDPIVVTSDEYRFIVKDQLGEIGIANPRIILEPCGRNTAPAVTLAALLVAEEDLDPILLVMASDHLIKDVPAFHRAVAEGAEQAERGLIVTFGIVPDRPDTGYGYVHVGPSAAKARTARDLAGFVEKPDVATAERYLAEGDYLWNSGIFMMKRSTWMAALDEYQPSIAQACRQAFTGAHIDGPFIHLDTAAFTACPSDSIDYAVMEKLGSTGRRAVVVPLDAGWSDVGAWCSLWTVCEKDSAGNVVQGDVILEDARGTLVHADSRLVAVLGVDDLAVIETADAVLVAARDKTQDLKALVDSVRERSEELTLFHRRVHRPWGFYESLDSGQRFQVKRIVVSPGASLSLQYHRRRAEHWVVVRGEAEVTCGDTTFRLAENQSTFVPEGAPHRLANPGIEPLEIIEVQSGDYLGEDDIVRLADDYGRLGDEPQ